ncbi:unnamed protein product [Boreogadus saida]
MIAASPLDSGPPRRGDQGDGGGTLGAYGRMYPPLPLCGPDGEYIFPGGLQESRHSVLSDINSVIGEYLVICSTPHVPQKGNPSAPPDYANHDAIQIPQQCQHPNPPTQQPPAERSGGVTKDESLNGGFDDNIQPHCSAMGGAATPHMKTKDEEDEIVTLRPLKKIESTEGRTILYEPSNPKDIERWSAEIDHPRRAGLQPWMQLKQLMHLYELHPYDGLAILFKHLSSTERTQIRYDVEDAIGEDGMRPEKGWDNNTDLDSLDLARKLIDTGRGARPSYQTNRSDYSLSSVTSLVPQAVVQSPMVSAPLPQASVLDSTTMLPPQSFSRPGFPEIQAVQQPTNHPITPPYPIHTVQPNSLAYTWVHIPPKHSKYPCQAFDHPK